ncbi:MAG TPA: protein kinase [Bryobacteraceae bacterium]
MPSHIGKYKILREIGRGGSGSVYEAYDPDVNRRVAIKVLHRSVDPDALARFRQEAAAAGNLRHKNIVTIYELGEFEGAPFIVMEYLEGDDLRSIIKNGPPLSLLEKLQIMKEVAEGLQYAHSQAVAHRDVKPGNVRVQPGWSVKIMDFGTARLLREEDTRLTAQGFVLGTFQYMAPEQFRGTDLGHMSDIYAYGVTLYELLSGKPPFAGDAAALMYKILHEAPAPLSAVVPDCPPALEALVFHALERDPAARYQSMEDVLIDTEPILQELGGRQAAELIKKIRKLLDANEFQEAQACLRQALALEPRNMEARELLADIRAARAASPDVSSLAEPAPAESPPLSLDAPPAPVIPSGEFTQIFRTAPPGQTTVSPTPEPVISKPVTGATRLFALPRHGAAPDQPLAVKDHAPTDTALGISNCADAAFLNAQAALDHFPFTIGRDGTDWNLTFDPAVSARHVEIDYREGGFFIRDLGSSNGTFLNGRRLKSLQHEVLLFGAHILLGSNTEIVFGSRSLKEIPDLCGTLVGNRFTLLEKLHTSSKSVLYLAQDENLARKVAIKLLSPSLSAHYGYREQFSREAQIASQLRHPRICQVLDYGEVRLGDPPGASTLYICTEFLPGGSLQSRLNPPNPFPLQTVVSWLDAICEALAYVHQRDVIHSGLKPSAIVFDAGEAPYLTDFAFGSRLGEGLRQTVVGSAAFLAPEQWEGAESVPATDQYSLSALFYYLITGSVPFEGQEHVVVRNRNFLRGPMPLHEMAARNGRPPLPDRIAPMFHKALALKPADRYPTVADFAAAVRSAMAEPDRVRTGPPSVFVSYHRAESSLLANMIKKEMERESGFSVFVDAIQQDSSGQFPLKLRRRIEQCDAFVCLLGRSTLRVHAKLTSIDSHRLGAMV